jgi:hypothetical protein
MSEVHLVTGRVKAEVVARCITYPAPVHFFRSHRSIAQSLGKYGFLIAVFCDGAGEGLDCEITTRSTVI